MSHIRKNRVDRCDQSGAGTPVVRQREFIPGMPRGFNVRKNIRSAEAVNRLFGITDQKQQAVCGGKEPGEDAVLNVVGILKFVDKSGLVFLADGLRKRVAPFFRQRLFNQHKQIFEELNIFLGLAHLQFR